MQSSFKIAALLTDVDGVEAGLAVVGLVDGGDGDDDADQHGEHARTHEHQAASPAAEIMKHHADQQACNLKGCIGRALLQLVEYVEGT